MSFTISGYVLEPIRVGQANSPYTQTPDNYVSNQGVFDAAYPSDESKPRTDYLVMALGGLLVNSEFSYTKNEIVDRFDYDSAAGRFRPLPGSSPVEVGTISADANTERLVVRPPSQAAPDPTAPYRLSVGATGSGTEFSVSVVALDSGFGSPPAGSVELSLESGSLNWNASDLTSYLGQPVRFQQQQFYSYSDSTGRLGLVSDTLLLNPLPGSGQHPLLRFGFGFYLTAVEVANETLFTSPVAGTVEWASDTGRLNFSPADIANYPTTPVYYDGVLIGTGLTLPFQDLGDISSPSNVAGLPPNGVDLIFALPGVYYQFPQFSYLDSSLFSSGQSGVIQVDPNTGAVQVSASDQAKYVGEALRVTFGDLEIERGVSVRLFRTPVNLDGTQGINDVTSIYPVTNAVWADPIIGAPQVFLPSVPVEDSGYPLVVKVEQGTGSYTDSDFPALDTSSPPAGLGYYLDRDESLLYFARRVEDEIVPVNGYPSVVLPDPLILEGNLVAELETAPGSGTYTTLTQGEDILVDPLTGGISFVNVEGSVLSEGSTGNASSVTFTDSAADFVSDGVSSGDLLEVLSPSSVQGVYTVASVDLSTQLTVAEAFPTTASSVVYRVRDGREVVADRYYSEVTLVDPTTSVERIRTLGAATNSPRLNVPVSYVDASGFRFGGAETGTFATVSLVADDGSFTSPISGTVEISQATGNLNFSSSDLGGEVFWSRTLEPKVDYKLSAELGLIQFTDRMLALEEVRVTYTTEPPSTDPPTDPDPPVQEYGRFLVRKEVTQDHPTPTSTLYFNPDGLDVASIPTPSVFRGGRPQQLGVQCLVDTSISSITFQPDNQITDALPHGPTIAPEERVYIDYYVLQAVGGENTITVLNPPLRTVSLSVVEDESEFTVQGDHTSSFPSDRMLRVENEQTYLIGSSSYDGGSDTTTVYLSGNQVFKETLNDPLMHVSSGPTPVVGAPLAPSYFVSELAVYEPVARGSQTFLVPGDRASAYRKNSVVLFTDGSSTFTDFFQVLASSYDESTDRTTVMLSAGVPRQYVSGSQLLLHSTRPIFESPASEFRATNQPVLSEDVAVYRKIFGEIGELLLEGVDYTIDATGKIAVTDPLLPNEEIGIWYTGLEAPTPGVNLRATYTHQVAPSGANGLEGQILRADFSVFSPDTFYCRVETMSNFRAEYSQEISDSASSGSSGPQTENASKPRLFEQGRESLYFEESHLANQDIIARATLLFYNDAVNLLEDYLQSQDGRVVGNNDGRLLFDGTTGSVHPPGAVGNQIDDSIQISNAPYEITYPPFSVTSIGTFRKYYRPGSKSRFYPTLRNFSAVSAVTAASVTGDEVVDTGSTSITSVSKLTTRLAWGVASESTTISGSGTINLDYADGTETGFSEQAQAYARPPFLVGMKCVVQRRDGSFINDSSSPITISAVNPNQISVSGLAGTVEPGDTVYRSPLDDSAQTGADVLNYYLSGRDFTFDFDTGQILFVEEIPAISNVPIVEAQALSGTVNLINTLTSPQKFPALFGGVEDDDGDLSFPIQTPDPNSEKNGYLTEEDKLIHSSSGTLRSITTSPFVGAANLNGAKTTITLQSGTFPSPVPQIHDLVRILTGPNAMSDFVRVVSSTASSVTVDTAFSFASTGFYVEVAVSGSTVASTATFPSTTSLQDLTASFLTTAKVGYTIVVTSGPNDGERRQISSVNSNTSLTITPALPSTSGGTYRIDDSLATYGGTANDLMTKWEGLLADQVTLLAGQDTSLLNFVDQVITDVTTGTLGQTTAGQPTLDDPGSLFLSDGVNTSHYVYVDAGPNIGFYQVTSVNSETQIEVTPNFPATASGVGYRVVSLFGVSKESVDAILTLSGDLSLVQSNVATTLALVSTPVPVVRSGVPDTDSFARGTLISSLDTRDSEVDTRLTEINTNIQTVEDILASTDRLYDARYTWIDARINLEDGLIVQQSTAESNRLKAQEDYFNELIKLLAVEGS